MSDNKLFGMTLVEEPTRDALAERLADDIAAMLASDMADTGQASLVVSGGSTPMAMFLALSGKELDWSRVTVTLADERWVAPGHAASNESLVREHLLAGKASVARFVPLYCSEADPESAIETIDAALQTMPRPFTVVVLGMGGDGHTASLFPDAPELEAGMTERARLVAAARPPSQPLARITLTRAALNASRNRLLHIVGDDKREVLDQAMADEPRMAPIARVIDEDAAGVTIYWAA